jgi:two-component system cell cycle sensor histidine kinase/response regulator CckA
MLQILHLEDNPVDGELIERLVRRQGIVGHFTRVKAREDFIGALQQTRFDLILSDFEMPGFDGLSALKIAHEQAPDCPFVFVSGRLGEDAAIESLTQGACDFIVKDRLGRLPSAIRRAIRDTSERAASKKALESVAEQAALLEMAQDAILVGDLQGRIEYWNRGAERLHGWTADEVRGRDAREFLFHDPSWFGDALKFLLQNGAWAGEVLKKTRSGGQVLVQTRWSLVRDSEGRPKSILSLSTDITGKKKLEEQVGRAQRMELVGALTGGIAHDIKNTLTPIKIGIELLREGVTTEIQESILATMHTSVERGSRLLERMLEFSRGVLGKPVLLDLRHLLSEVDRLVSRSLPGFITVETRMGPELRPVMGNGAQLSQLLLHLCVNAREAMPAGGTLKLAAANVELENKVSHWQTIPLFGPYVMLSVSDTGQGIPPHLVDRLFAPVYLNEDSHRATGLGLSTVQGIVKSHGGFLEVSSAPGKGTTVQVYLPAHLDR